MDLRSQKSAVTLLSLLALSASSSAQVTYRTVALSGLQVPTFPIGATYQRFADDAFRINASGTVAFYGSIAGPGPSDALFSGTESPDLLLLASEDDNIAGLPAGSSLSGSFTSARLWLNSNGQVAFGAAIEGALIGEFNNVAIVLGHPAGGLEAVAQESVQAGGLPPGVNYHTISRTPVFNDAGQILFRTSLQGDGVQGFNDSALMLYSPESGVHPGVREGQTVSGLPFGVRFGSLQDTFLLNDAGRFAFGAPLAGPGVTTMNNFGLYRSGVDGAFVELAREGSQVPGFQPGTVYFSLDFGTLRLNDAGETTFVAQVAGDGLDESNRFVVMHEDGNGNYTVLARQGDLVGGLPNGVKYAGFGRPAMNDLGQHAHVIALVGEGVTPTNDIAILSDDGDQGMRLVAREGELAPGFSDGTTFGLFLSNADAFQINNAGQIAFYALLNGVASQPEGIFVAFPDGRVEVVAALGPSFDLDPRPDVEDIRVVSNIYRPFDFNDLGQLAVNVRFDDGTFGLFVANTVPPCPPDTNNDGTLSPADFGAWIAAFNAQSPACDQNADSLCTPADFGAWIANFNAGC